MKNYKEQVLSMMNLKINIPFMLRDNRDNRLLPGRYFINDSMEVIEENTNLFFISIKHLITEEFSVVKESTEKEKIAIEYAKACGCNWIAEDKDRQVYAYACKPKKENTMWKIDDGKYIKILLPLSFIRWEDKEPYRI